MARKIFILSVLTTVFFISANSAYGQTTMTASTTSATPPAINLTTEIGPTVNENDLSMVGFTGVKLQPAATNKFLPPVIYFRVNQTVAKTNPEWGDSADLVSVIITKMWNSSWTYNKGQMTINELAGRTQALVSTPGYYIAITGPDHDKVVTLANILKTK